MRHILAEFMCSFFRGNSDDTQQARRIWQIEVDNSRLRLLFPLNVCTLSHLFVNSSKTKQIYVAVSFMAALILDDVFLINSELPNVYMHRHMQHESVI